MRVEEEEEAIETTQRARRQSERPTGKDPRSTHDGTMYWEDQKLMHWLAAVGWLFSLTVLLCQRRRDSREQRTKAEPAQGAG